MHSSKCRCTHVILMKDGLDELNIRRSSRGDKFTIVSRALVINSSSSAPKGRRKADQKPFFQSLNVGYIGKDSHTQVAIFKQVFPSMRQWPFRPFNKQTKIQIKLFLWIYNKPPGKTYVRAWCKLPWNSCHTSRLGEKKYQEEQHGTKSIKLTHPLKFWGWRIQEQV